VTEACTAVTFAWAVRLDDQRIDQLLPPCSTIQISIRDDQGNLLHRSTEAIGEWTTNPAQSAAYRVTARSLAGTKTCQEAQSAWLEVVREHRLYVEPDEPSTPSIVAGKAGTLTVRLSCPAPPEGAQVDLLSSDRNILRLPASVLVLSGERSAPVQFGTAKDHHGNVTITARLANHRDSTLRYEVLEHLTAIVLSGGGAKGSFEVGALLYLREIWNEIQPRIICGTSVGAINALALAEATTSQGVDKIENVWLDLQYRSDMYEPSPELAQGLETAEVSLDDFVAFLSEQGGPDFGYGNILNESAVAPAAVVGFLVGDWIGLLTHGAIAGGITTAAKLVALLEAVSDGSFFFHLTPTRGRIAAVIDRLGIATSGMKLRLAAVALEDGELYYITEASTLIARTAAGVNAEPINDPDPLVLGALASAAFPVFFQAQQIRTPTTLLTFVDGGVREVLPSHAAVELGAQLIFNISAATSDPPPKLGEIYASPGGLLPIMLRALELQGNEIVREEMHPRARFCDERERVLIHPTFSVHHLLEIDPGLIRINMAYGYFRAFDADQLRRGTINAVQYIFWRLWTDELIEERRRCHELENSNAMQVTRLTSFFSHGVMQSIRNCKNRVAELIEQRFEQFGATAFPRKLSNSTMGDQAVLDWCGTWEVHQDPQRGFLNAVNLWDAQITERATASGDGPGHPLVLESEVLQQYPLPAAVRDGLRFH
jgi:NTE family protein